MRRVLFRGTRRARIRDDGAAVAEQVGRFVHLGRCCGTSVCFRVLSVRDRDRQAVHVPELIGEGGDGAAGGKRRRARFFGQPSAPHAGERSRRRRCARCARRARAVEAQAGGLPHLPHARELVVPRGTHGRARAVESQRADRVRVPPGGVGRVRASLPSRRRRRIEGARRLERRERAALGVEHAHLRAERDGDERPVGIHRDQRSRGLPHVLAPPVLTGAALSATGAERSGLGALVLAFVPSRHRALSDDTPRAVLRRASEAQDEL